MYEKKKNGTDDYSLKYKDKELKFHTDLSIMKEMQSISKRARIKMVTDLAKQGVSLKDFTIEKKENGKTYYDNSNKAELEKAYIDDETATVFNEIIEKQFGMDLMTLLQDIGLQEEKEVEKFSMELMQALIGKTPSGGKAIEKL